ALMVAHGALRAGAGAVTITTWTDALATLQARVVEVMTAPISADPASIDAALTGKRAVVVGPGFGVGDDARAVVEHVVAKYAGALVADADGLTVFARRPEGFVRKAPTILTPHSAEAARLLGVTSDEVDADRLAA